MIFEYDLINCINIESIDELHKLKPYIEGGVKVNYSRLAREHGVDRRTIKKRINGFTKSETRNKGSKLDIYYDLTYRLLYGEQDQPSIKLFYYVQHLYDYMKERKLINDDVKLSTFKYWIKSNDSLSSYFSKSKIKKVQIRYETNPGVQAQVDWKEDVNFIDNKGNELKIQVLSVLLGNSRFRYYGVSLYKDQKNVFHHINRAFELFGGVPHELLCDNMKTIMDVARTENYAGKVNNKFMQFANDYGFKVKPCIAGKPKTKGKVESIMKVLDIISAYNGDVNYEGLVKVINDLNNKENSRYHASYGKFPILALEKEKDFLYKLPCEAIRNQYVIKTINVKVDSAAHARFNNSTYSVPVELVGKKVKLQVHDNKLHIYYNTKLVTIHDINHNKGSMNIKQEHYLEALQTNMNYLNSVDIESLAKENLKKIGDSLNEHNT